MKPAFRHLALLLWLCGLALLAHAGPYVSATINCPATAQSAQAAQTHGDPWLASTQKHTPDAATHYVATRSGRILKLDSCTLQTLAQSPPTGEWSQLALSEDGYWLLAGSRTRGELQVFNADLQPVKTLGITTLDGRLSSGTSQMLDMPVRRSFIIAFERLPEIWELSYSAKAEPVFDGLVHDYRMGEGMARPGFLHPRRTPLNTPVAELRLAGDCCRILARAAQPAQHWSVIHLDVRRKIGEQP